MAKRPQWSRTIDSALDGIIERVIDLKAHHLAGGRVHLWVRFCGYRTPLTPSYNELVEIIEDEFKLKGYKIDKENRKWDVDGPLTKGNRRWVTEVHIYLYPPA